MNLFKRTNKKVSKSIANVKTAHVVTNPNAIVGGTEIIYIRAPRYRGERG